MKAEEKVDAAEVVPNDVRRRILERQKNRQLDLIHQVAFMESGLSAYRDEDEFCDQFGVSRQELEAVKKLKRDEIERFKEEHREGKFMLVRMLGRRERYMMMLEDAVLKGNKEMEDKVRALLNILNECAPLSDMKKIAETLKLVGHEAEPGMTSATQVNIMVSPAMAEAEKDLKEIQNKKKVVEV